MSTQEIVYREFKLCASATVSNPSILLADDHPSDVYHYIIMIPAAIITAAVRIGQEEQLLQTYMQAFLLGHDWSYEDYYVMTEVTPTQRSKCSTVSEWMNLRALTPAAFTAFPLTSEEVVSLLDDAAENCMFPTVRYYNDKGTHLWGEEAKQFSTISVKWGTRYNTINISGDQWLIQVGATFATPSDFLHALAVDAGLNYTESVVENKTTGVLSWQT